MQVIGGERRPGCLDLRVPRASIGSAVLRLVNPAGRMEGLSWRGVVSRSAHLRELSTAVAFH